MLINRTNQSAEGSIKLADLSLTYFFEQAKEQSYQLAAGVTEREEIKNLLCSNKTVLSGYEEYNATRQYISELTKIGLTSKVESVYVYSGFRKKLITSNNGVFRVQDINNYKWFQEAQLMDGNKALKWIGYCRYLNEYQWEPNAYMISLICKAHMINRSIKTEVYFGLNFNESDIFDIFRDINITPNTMVYLTDDDGIILSADNKRNIGMYIGELLGTDIFSGYNGRTSRITINREGYQRIIEKNSPTDWNIVVLIPENELFEESRFFWVAITLFLILLSAGSIFLGYRTIVRYVDAPVMRLVSFMKEVEKGDFNIRIVETRKDEFGALYSGFNEMVGKISILIRELYQEKLIKRDVELKYLQKLINPHFLYNTLDTVNWLARENRLSDVSALTLALSNQYRTIFNRGQDYIPLGICLHNIENYLFIHRIRYGEMFSYHIHCDASIKDILILNLTLQPAIENALIHGIQSRDKTGGRVVVSARKRKNTIHVRIYDNGTGMRREKLKIIKVNMNADRKNNDSGMKIVHHRIKLFYGDKYGIRIRSSFRRGTCVSIIFPAYELIDLKRKSIREQMDSMDSVVPDETGKQT
jgi:two-component system sensor histidine kinase YesM